MVETANRTRSNPPPAAFPPPESPRSGGVEGNARLTGSTAVILLVLLAVEGVTVLFIRPLLSVHVFVGVLLIPPAVVKLGSTGWRLLRYYMHSRPYVVQGPPPLVMRVLIAPAVVISTAILLGSGVALLIAGPEGGVVLALHKASFVIWLFAMSAHVLAHIRRVPSLAAADWRRRTRLPAAGKRLSLIVAAVGVGVLLAVVSLRLAGPWLDWKGMRH